ncbi:unnamed protein product, partial [marine sediment metagenome]
YVTDPARVAGAGINLATDNLETITSKLAKYDYTQEIIDIKNTMAEEGYQYLSSMAGITDESQITRMTDSKGKVLIFKNSPEKLKDGGAKAPKKTGMDAALDAAANQIITLEGLKASSPESYWKLVDEFAEDMGLARGDADRAIMNRVKEIKGEEIAVNQLTGEEENIASDFEVVVAGGEDVFGNVATGVSLNTRAKELIKPRSTLLLCIIKSVALVICFPEGILPNAFTVSLITSSLAIPILLIVLVISSANPGVVFAPNTKAEEKASLRFFPAASR